MLFSASTPPPSLPPQPKAGQYFYCMLVFIIIHLLGPEYGLDVLYLNESLNASLDLSILSDVGVGLALFLLIFIV